MIYPAWFRFKLHGPRSLLGKAVILMALQAALAPATAQTPTNDIIERAAPSPELFGVKIGTAAETATRLLQQRGFVLRGKEAGPSWGWQFGTQTGLSVRRADRESTTAAVMEGPAGEQLELAFTQTRNGAAVSRISARWPTSVAPATLADVFERRYGVSKGTMNTIAIRAVGERGQVVQPYMLLDAEARVVVLDAEEELRTLEQESVQRAVRDYQTRLFGW